MSRGWKTDDVKEWLSRFFVYMGNIVTSKRFDAVPRDLLINPTHRPAATKDLLYCKL
jgi:hypothetical protein